MAALRNTLVLASACLLAILGLIAPSAASAAPPSITLAKEAPETALLGTKQKAALVAKNPAGQERGYNLTFRDVLPVGVTYVPGSAGENAPQVLEDKPGIGMTTLIFENVADLSPNSEFRIDYEVEPLKSFFKFVGEKAPTYTNEAEAFISEEPRTKPGFNSSGEPTASPVVGVAIAKATTELTAIEIEKEEKSPEGEILRGVHEHQRVYTLTVRNNDVGPTRGIADAGGPGVAKFVVEDWLPAGLEFLGCGEVDNTTETATNPGSPEEYPGSGPINQGTPPEAPNCEAPFYVATEEVDPPGKQPPGVYTHVKFLGPGELAPGAKFEIQYVAAIPILQNTTEWLGPEPTAASLGQIASLDNNTGKETSDEEELTNTAQAQGEYETSKVKDLDEMTRTAEDLAIQKGTESKGEDLIFDGAETTWTLNVETSEYRFQEPVSIVDQLPDGLCPIGPINYEGPPGEPIVQPKEECEASTKRHPVIEYLKKGPGAPGAPEQIEYSSFEEEKEGGFKLAFDETTVPDLAHLEPSQELQIRIPTNTRAFYQDEFEDDKPVLTGDSWSNEVHTFGTGFSRCFVEKVSGEIEADPNCVGETAQPIVAEEPGGTPVEDFSEASQQASGVTIEKTVRENNGKVPKECDGSTEEYVKGLLSVEEELPQYRPGDEICWRLVVKFASNIYAGKPVVSDFIPPDETYVPESEFKGPENTVIAEFNKEAAKEEVLEWEILEGEENSVKPKQIFEYRFKTKVSASPKSRRGEITGNLMKFLYSNSEGETFPERDRAEVQRQEPDLSLQKGITEVGGEKIIGGPVSSEVVGGGEEVQYTLNVKNTGNLDAEEAEVWDELPEGIECAAVTLPKLGEPPFAECDPATNTIKWTGVKVAKGATTPLTYLMMVPTEYAPSHPFVNLAGVTTFKSETNTGEEFEYFPKNNIDTALNPKMNTHEIRAQAEITTTSATLKKSATTSITLPGNEADNATIGEYVEYTVTATIPPNSQLFGTPVLEDNLPTNLELDSASVEATLDGRALGAGLTLETAGNRAAVKFTAPYPPTPEAEEHAIVLTYKALVLDVAANKTGASIANKATLEFEDKNGRESEIPPATVTTPVVEPQLLLTKTNLLPPSAEGKVAPGQTVEYQTEVTNTGSSTAYETVVTDTVPKGMEIADPGTGTEVGEGTIEWHIPTIAAGATEKLTYKLEVVEPAPAASKFTNVAVAETQSVPDVSGVEQPQTRKPGSPESGGYKDEDSDTVKLIEATVNKEVTPEDGTIGTELTYTLHMHLQPEIDYSNTTVVDQLPEGVSFEEFENPECTGEEPCPTGHALASQPGPNGTTLIGWYFGDYAHGAARELNVEIKAHINKKAAKGALTNVLGGFYNEKDEGEPTELPVPGSNTPLFNEETKPDTATVTMHEPELTLTKSVTGGAGPGGKLAVPGNTYEYTLTVTNSGDWPAYDFEVKDEPPANLTGFELLPSTGAPITATPISGPGEAPAWHIAGPLPKEGGKIELHYKAKLIDAETLKTGDPVDNEAEVPTYFGLTPEERGPGTEFIEYPRLDAEEELEVELPQITLTKTTGGGVENEKADVGDPFKWRITVANTAEFAGAKEALVEDLLPSGWTYVAGSAKSGGAPITTNATPGNPETLTWNLASLAPAEGGAPKAVEIEFEATPQVGATAGTNKAVVHALDEAGGEDDALHTYEAEDEATAEVVAPAFEINKTPDNGTAIAGEPAEYEIEVKNIGKGDATQPIEVEDELGAEQIYVEPSSLPPGVTQVSVEPSSRVGPATIVWTVTSLKAGEAVHIPVPIEVPSSDAEGSTLENSATVSSPQAPNPESDEGAFEVERETKLKIEKEADRTEVNGGEKIVYTLTVTNEGLSDASGVTVTDAKPEGAEFLKAAPKAGKLGTCNLTAAEITCNVPVLPMSEPTTEFEVEVQVETGRLLPIVNTAEVTGNEFDPELENNHATKQVEIGGSADLSIVKKGPEQPVLLGSTFKYQLEVSNEGPSDATNVEVLDELPEELEFIEASSPEGTTCDEVGGTLTCDLGRLLPKSPTVLIEVTVKAIELPAAGSKAVNTAEVTSSTLDPEPENDHSTAETEILPAADLAIAKTAPATVEPNGELTYKLHVENLGPSPAHGVVVHDPLPAGVEFVKTDEGCAAASGTVTCEVPGELPMGGEADFQITVHVPYPLGGQSLVNTAMVEGEEADPHTENNLSTVTTTVGPAADLSITKTMGKAQAGEPLTYTLAVTNHGPSDSSAVTVKDTLPAGTTFKSAAPSQGTCSAAGQSVTCDLGPLAAGGSAQISITVDVAVTATGSLRNVATVEGPEPDPDKSNNESAVEGPVTPAPPTAPNLKVVKTADTSTPEVGKPFDYHVAITNLSGGEAKNVKVVDTLNGPVKVLSIETEAGSCHANGSKISCSIPSIAVGKTVNITYSVVAESAGALSNTASAQASNGEVAPSNNHAVKSVKAKDPKQATYSLTKTASKKVVDGGKKVAFTITLRNGAAALTDAKVCDRLPAALVFVKAAGARYVNGEACWTKKYVAAHKVLRLHLAARAVKGYKSRQARNVATAHADNAAKRSAAATVRIKPAFAGKPGGVTG